MDADLNPGSNVLITGATGLIGGEIVRRLAEGGTGTVWTLVRPKLGEGPSERLRRRLARSGNGEPGRVRAVSGDVTLPGWGLKAEDARDVAERADWIIHVAADTAFGSRGDTARTNVESVRQLIGLARGCRRAPKVAYMGTATSVGDVKDRCVDEAEGGRSYARHHNEYTQSKAIAEELLAASGLPAVTLLPTIVLSAGLPDREFARQILWFAALGMMYDALPIKADARLDLVDVGFVADATLALLASGPLAHDRYHLSAGPNGAIRFADLTRLVEDAYGRDTPVRLVPPDQWGRQEQREYVRSAVQRRMYRSLGHYLPFINMDVVYDDSRLRQAVGPNPPVRPVGDYIGDLFKLIQTEEAILEAAIP